MSFKTACEYPVCAGKIVNSMVATNRGWGSTNHFHIFVPIEAYRGSNTARIADLRNRVFNIKNALFLILWDICSNHKRHRILKTLVNTGTRRQDIEKNVKKLLKRHHFYDTFNCLCYCQCAAAQESDSYLLTCRTNNHRKLPNWFGKLKLELVR